MWTLDGGTRLLPLMMAAAMGAGPGRASAQNRPPEGMRYAPPCPDVVESVEGARNDTTALVYGVVLVDHPPDGDQTEYTHRLALNDLRAAVAGGGLPAGPGKPPRPVVVVMCAKDLPENDSVTARAVEHLIQRFGVSAIVTLTSPQALAAQRTIAASGASVLLICDQCAAEVREVLSGIGDTSLVFQSYAPRASFTALIHQKLPDFEAYVRRLRGFDGSPGIRVALISPDSDLLRAFAANVDETLVINGARAALQRGTNYLHAVYEDPRSGRRPATTEVGARLAAFRPHIVMGISLGRSPELLAILNALERHLEPSAPKPLYWGWVHRLVLEAFIGGDDDRRTRVYTYAPGSGPPTPEQRERRVAAAADFQREFPGAPVELAFNLYPVPYQLMYAAVGAGPVARLTGADLARGIAHTQQAGAKEVYIGRRDLARGLAEAAAGPIALNNLNNLFPQNWSRSASGAAVPDSARIYCFTRNAAGALVATSAGQVWERRTNSLSGTFVPCR